MLVTGLFFEPTGEAAVRDIWEDLANAGAAGRLVTNPFDPHLSLGTVPFERRREHGAQLAAFAAKTDPIPMTMAHIGFFMKPVIIAFLGVTVTNVLLEAHRTFYELCAETVDLGTNFVPDLWVPHCTVAYDLPADELAAAIEICLGHTLPITTTAERVALLESESGKVLYQYPLGRSLPERG